jgi:hypothetical protein
MMLPAGLNTGRKHLREGNEMTRTLTLLTVGAALVLPLAASAQTPADVAYCKKLGLMWYTYFNTDPSTAVATALNNCSSASAASIPVLEKALKDEGFTLPKRKM